MSGELGEGLRSTKLAEAETSLYLTNNRSRMDCFVTKTHTEAGLSDASRGHTQWCKQGAHTVVQAGGTHSGASRGHTQWCKQGAHDTHTVFEFNTGRPFMPYGWTCVQTTNPLDTQRVPPLARDIESHTIVSISREFSLFWLI